MKNKVERYYQQICDHCGTLLEEQPNVLSKKPSKIGKENYISKAE